MPMTSFLESNPEITYKQRLMGLQPQISRFFENRYYDVYKEYQSELATNPYLSFDKFLSTYNFPQKFGGYSPRLRGEYPSIVSPRARWLNY
uniref:Uncharacterized protein n=1 Tax=viral metagenome TaxID=1070528 RepID=A0A6M3K3J5_9ZZZZ